jgi:uncharacterized small protein (DUF1192 family)
MDVDDENLPQKAKRKRKDLTQMGVEELKAYIAELETEIARTRQAIAAKQSHGADVERFFKK